MLESSNCGQSCLTGLYAPAVLQAQGVSNLREWTKNTKPIWIWLETTHISKSGSGRKPTPAEVKAELWLALIAGAQGYGYFCHQFFEKEVRVRNLRSHWLSEIWLKKNSTYVHTGRRRTVGRQ